MSWLRPAYCYARLGFKSMVADRAMLLVDFFLATTVPYLIQFLIWRAVFSASTQESIEGFRESQLTFYYAYALALGRLNNGYDIIRILGQDVREGRLELHLLRPLSIGRQRLFAFLGESALYFVPLLLIAATQAAVQKAPDIVGSLVLILLSQWVCFNLSFFLASFSLWLGRADSLLSLSILLPGIFGGTLLPPDFWPEFIQPLMRANPFRYMISAPAEYLIRPSPALLKEAVLGCGVYIALFAGARRLAWKQGIDRSWAMGG